MQKKSRSAKGYGPFSLGAIATRSGPVSQVCLGDNRPTGCAMVASGPWHGPFVSRGLSPICGPIAPDIAECFPNVFKYASEWTILKEVINF